MTVRTKTGLAALVGTLGPLALAAAWIPIRLRLPNTDLALLLVLGVVAVGAFGQRSAVVTTSISAALWFEFFDTRPFERLAIARKPDLETTLVLAVVSFVAGEMTVRTVRQRARRIVESAEMGASARRRGSSPWARSWSWSSSRWPARSLTWFEGNFEAYEEARRERLGAAADRPHRISYKRLVRN